MKNTSLVTVVIPVYNGERVLAETLDSVLAQDYPNLEIVVVDDGSTDATADLLSGYVRRDPRIKPVRFVNNAGLSAARNAGMLAAKGDYLAFCDADDVMMLGRLSLQVEFLEHHPELAACGTGVEFFGDMQGRVVPETDPDRLAMKLMFSNELFISSVMARASFVRANDIHFEENDPQTVEDWLFYRSILLSGGKMANLPLVLMRYRRSATQLSADLCDTAFCRATLLRAELLADLGVEKEDMDLEAHVAISPCYWPLRRAVPPEAFDADRQQRWLGILAVANCRTGKYPKASFEKILNEVWHAFQQRQH
jgi:glycosyltransferase involved in cell wall biosynthesis